MSLYNIIADAALSVGWILTRGWIACHRKHNTQQDINQEPDISVPITCLDRWKMINTRYNTEY